ncbi:DUF3307 domain-containing protein [Halomonas beimenensis]|uniref:DUF3307 domain-containing protein n=1 Tax=Halomonas beimenensis TaxID=475662 RepID=A0A291P600_9GAMM|nr:DUF3307 domain-containing protein [Halomonas beimenensis]ATJ82301.1 hypothetical protein BEI_1314 [Halomonas beimenensis]
MSATPLAALLALLLAHLVGDFLLQPRRWVEARQRHKGRATALYLHAGLHGLLTLGVLGLAGAGPIPAFLAGLAVAGSHGLIDLGKAWLDPHRLRWFLLDQALHLAVLLAVWLAWQGSAAPLAETLAWLASPGVLTLALAYLLVTRPMALAIALAMRPWSDEVADPGTLAAAGARIGILERLLVLTLVLVDEFTAVGFLLTAKSVLRFGDLRERRDRKLTEYVLLGTLLSVSATLALGLLVRATPWVG